jgi:hypothetical protein
MRTKRWGVARILQGLALLALGGCTAASRPPSPHDAVDEGALFEVIDRDQSGTVTRKSSCVRGPRGGAPRVREAGHQS